MTVVLVVWWLIQLQLSKGCECVFENQNIKFNLYWKCDNQTQYNVIIAGQDQNNSCSYSMFISSLYACSLNVTTL